MISLIGALINLAGPLIAFILKRVSHKEDLQRKMYEFLDRHSDEVQKSDRLRKEYEALREKFKKPI